MRLGRPSILLWVVLLAAATEARATPGFDGVGGIVQGGRQAIVFGGNLWYEHSLGALVDADWAEPMSLRATVGLWPLWRGQPNVWGTNTFREQFAVPVLVGVRHAFGGSLDERSDAAFFLGLDVGASLIHGLDPATTSDNVASEYNTEFRPSAFVEAGAFLGGMRFSVYVGLPSLAHPGNYSLFGTIGFGFFL